jgi:hypothetical protein
MSTAPPVEGLPVTAPAAPALSEPDASGAPRARLSRDCDNCGAPLAGTYCASCGQRREPPIHSLWHFAKVATEDLTHADSRVWRTLWALLCKPGYLTAQFLAGRRARYLPPLRLYLVLSVLFFLWAGMSHPNARVVQLADNDSDVPKVAGTPLSEKTLAGENPQQGGKRVCQIDYAGPGSATFDPLMTKACRAVQMDNGRTVQQAFMHNVPRAMFLFLPLLAGVMMLMYWRPRHYYVEHLLWFVHNHACGFLVLMLAWALVRLLPFARSLIDFAVFLYIPWYVFRSMRVVYGQGRLITVAKLVVLSFWYLVFGSLMVGLTTVYSALTL